jgi:hypothetical protein
MNITMILGWIVWGIVALVAIGGAGFFVWQVIEAIKTPIYFWNERIAGWALRFLLGLQVALLGTVAFLFLENAWEKLHLLWVAPICCFPMLLMRVVFNWFMGSLKEEKRFVEDLVGPIDPRESDEIIENE